ncbi:virion structural protein [Synechococcus phage S-WAM2]|uniref:Structural protein n=1 Tax=Synechococcus phage S-WAM2 TaxID=1815522 RepID=A0A1D8KTF5_9CAUD|nr:virion structural protein [Synechococcus phage S-WAM2]AOV61889.1 structural protein [Synechococcus phage S-WAM2]
MADRFPLIVNPVSQKIEEIVAGDNLDLTGNNIVVGGDTGAGKYLTSDGSVVSWGAPGDVYLDQSQTVTNKTFETCSISGVLNTLVNIPNSSLTNSRITINGTDVPLGGSINTANDNTTYTISAVDGATAVEKIIRLTSAGFGSGVTDDITLAEGSNVTLTRSGDTITIASSFTDTNTVTELRGTTSGNYVTGQVTIAGGGDTTVTQVGNTITVSTNDQDTITRVKGGVSGTFESGDISILQAGATTVSQTGNNITVSSQDTITTLEADDASGTAVTGAVVIAATNAASVSQSGNTITIDAVDTNTVTRVRATATGTYNSGDITIVGSGATTVSQVGTTITVDSEDTDTTYQASNGLNLSGTSFELKNNANLLQDKLSKWDASNAQFTNSIISDDGSTVTVDGNLTVNGTSNKVVFETQTLVIADEQIELRKGNSITGQNGGLQVNRTTDATGTVLTYSAMQWFETGGYWRVYNGINAFRLVTETETQTLTNKTLTSPTMTNPTLGIASATSFNKLIITAPANSATLTIADGKTVTANNTVTLSGVDNSTISFGNGGLVAYRADKLSVFAATTSTELRGTITDETGIGALVFAQSPTLINSIITSSESFDIINTSATTVNAFGAATSITIGSNSSGTTVIRHGLDVNGAVTLGTDENNAITVNGVLSSANTDLYIRGSRAGLGNNDTVTNLIFGLNSGSNFTTGDFNTSYGYETLYLDNEGSRNAGFGYNALRNTTTGSDNTAVGYRALRDNVVGARNTAVGQGALENNQIGGDNVCIGYYAGYGLSGSGNVLIGSASTGDSTSFTYAPLTPTGNNQLVIGSGTDYWLRGDGSFNVTIAHDLNVSNNLNIGGNLTVEGQLTTLNINTLTVDDKNIELAAVEVLLGKSGDVSGTTIINIASTDDMYAGQQLFKVSGTGVIGTGAYITSIDSDTQISYTITGGAITNGDIVFDVGGPNDDTADGAGITVLGSTNKTFNWVKSSAAFTSSEHINIASGKTLKMATVEVISGSRIGPTTGSYLIGAGVAAFEGSIEPNTDANLDFGSPTKRWANIYSADLQLSNEGSANDVDGTWGQYTIQEGEEDLFLINRRSGKKYKFMLQEVN